LGCVTKPTNAFQLRASSRTDEFQHRSIYFDSVRQPTKVPTRDSQLHVIIPATHTDTSLCKTILSSAVLNYSTPTILEWDQESNNAPFQPDGRYVADADITAISNHLRGIETPFDEDLILVIDGSDTWFQLRPEHLIQRYYDINLALNQRLYRQMGKAMNVERIYQSILFGTQPDCSPSERNEQACYAVPEVSIRHKMGRGESRPLFLSTSFIMGPVGRMRDLFSAAEERAIQTKYQGTARELFEIMLHEQEHWRGIKEQARLSLKWWRMSSVLSRLGLWLHSQKLHPTYQNSILDNHTQHEFGIGLDLTGQLGQSRLEEFAWIIANETHQIAHASPNHTHDLLIDIMYSKSRVPKPLRYSSPPFADPVSHPSFPRYNSWSDVPLFTNVHSGTIPVMVQQVDGEFWNQLWWHKHAMEFLQIHMDKERGPVAIAEGRRWWSANGPRGGVEVTGMGFVGWEDMCGRADVIEDLFGQND
jgi:hypothetical protein